MTYKDFCDCGNPMCEGSVCPLNEDLQVSDLRNNYFQIEDWIKEGMTKPSNIQFTEGDCRLAGQLIETAINRHKEKVKEAIQKCWPNHVNTETDKAIWRFKKKLLKMLGIK